MTTGEGSFSDSSGSLPPVVRRSGSIRRRLITIIASVSFLTILAAGLVLVSTEYLRVRRALVADVGVHAEMIAHSCRDGLSANEPESVRSTLATLRSRPSLTAAWVLSSDGRVFASYQRDKMPLLSPPTLSDRNASLRSTFLVCRPISSSSEQLGQVCLLSDGSELGYFLSRSAGVLAMVLIGSTVLALFLADRAQRVVSTPILQLARTARQISRTKDFSMRPAEVDEDELGQLSDAFGVMLAKVQRREAALKRSEERFRALVETTSDWIWEVDHSFVYTYSSPKVMELLGYEVHEVVGRNPGDLEASATSASIREQCRQLLAAGRPFSGVIKHCRHRDGRVVILETAGVPVAADDGSLAGFRGIDRDVTERVRIEERLRVRERFLSNLAGVSQQLLRGEGPQRVLPDVVRDLGEASDSSHCCMFTRSRAAADQPCLRLEFLWSAEHVTHPLDVGAMQELAYQGTEFNTSVESLANGGVVAGDLSTFPPRVAAVLADHQIHSVLAIPVSAFSSWYGALGFADCREGRQWHNVEVDLLRVAAAEVGAAIENASLVKRLRLDAATLEDRVVERTAELESVNRELEAFSYSVSHDLRAPLRSIDGFAEALLEDLRGPVSDDAMGHLQRIRVASARMGRLIDGLLSLSRLSRRKLTLEPVDLSEVARSVCSELAAQNGDRFVELVVQDGLEIRADPDLMRVVMENLIGNAWKFTSRTKEARIEVGGEERDRERVFWVRDNGVGFDMDFVDRLFGAFQRLHSAAEFEGSGIGLATVQRIIHRHGGKVWAEGIVGRGATFYFSSEPRRRDGSENDLVGRGQPG